MPSGSQSTADEGPDYRALQVQAVRPLQLRQTRCRPSPVEVASTLYPYIRGPLDLTWMARAAGISHATLAVGLMLWHLRSLQRSRTVRVEPRWYGAFNVHRNTVRRALAALARAGLVRLEERPGLPAEVTLLAREPRASDAGGSWEGSVRET